MAHIYRFSLGLVFFTLCFTAQAAQAQTSRMYFAGYLGLSTFNDLEFSESTTPSSGDIEADNTINYSGALGLRLSRNFRVEAEASYRKAEFDRVDFSNGSSFKMGGDVTSWAGLMNVYYDFDLGMKIEPFIGAGVGFGWHDGNIDDISGFATDASDSATNFLWQAGGGVKYRVSPTFAFSGAYRYLDGTDLEFGAYDLDYGSHEFRLGFEYDLPFE